VGLVHQQLSPLWQLPSSHERLRTFKGSFFLDGRNEYGCHMKKGKELNDFQRIPLEIEILSNLRFGSLEIRDTLVTTFEL
jgi:hypothetical protein